MMLALEAFRSSPAQLRVLLRDNSGHRVLLISSSATTRWAAYDVFVQSKVRIRAPISPF
jgi:hypothetical protein